MDKTEAAKLVAYIRTLMLAHARAVPTLPERKRRAAQAKINNLSRRMSAVLAPLDKISIGGMPFSASSDRLIALQSKNIDVGKITLKKHASMSPNIASEEIFSQEEAIALAVYTWRLMYAHERAIDFIPQEEQQTEMEAAEKLFHSIFFYILKSLKQHGLKIVYFEGIIYEPNRPVHAVNADDFENEEPLIVSRTMEPALVKTESGRVLYFAKVLLVRANDALTIGE